jgi:short-subunit dehydrogenase
VLGPWRLLFKMTKSALITGAGSGIGRGLALALARRGYDLFLLGRDESSLHVLAGEIESFCRPSLYRVDLSDRGERARFVDRLLSESASPSLVIHNAALMPSGDFLQLPLAQIEATLAVNLLAPAELTRRLCASSPAPEGIIFILSTAARFPQPFNSLYSATKAGLRFLAESLQVELAGKTRVCLAYPPLTETPMTARFTAPIPKADAQVVAEKIIHAYERGQDEIIQVDWEVFAVMFYRLFPRLFRHLLKLQRRSLAKTFHSV